MKHTEANLKGVLSRMEKLSALDRYPRNEEGLKAVAEAIMDIVDDQPECWEEKYDPDQGKGVRIKTRDAMSVAETLDWLIGRVLAACPSFPPPIAMRKIYETQFTAADGKLSGELEV